MTEYTPGPWEHGQKFSDSQDEIQAMDGRCVAVVWTRRTNNPGRFVPTMCFRDDPQGQANAHLIAAAPELLASLELMVDMFERHIEGRPGPDDAANRWDLARAAIAKARGTDER